MPMIAFMRNRVFIILTALCGLSLIASISGAVKKDLNKEKVETGSRMFLHLDKSDTSEHLQVNDTLLSGSKIWFTGNADWMIY